MRNIWKRNAPSPAIQRIEDSRWVDQFVSSEITYEDLLHHLGLDDKGITRLHPGFFNFKYDSFDLNSPTDLESLPQDIAQRILRVARIPSVEGLAINKGLKEFFLHGLLNNLTPGEVNEVIASIFDPQINSRSDLSNALLSIIADQRNPSSFLTPELAQSSISTIFKSLQTKGVFSDPYRFGFQDIVNNVHSSLRGVHKRKGMEILFHNLVAVVESPKEVIEVIIAMRSDPGIGSGWLRPDELAKLALAGSDVPWIDEDPIVDNFLAEEILLCVSQINRACQGQEPQENKNVARLGVDILLREFDSFPSGLAYRLPHTNALLNSLRYVSSIYTPAIRSEPYMYDGTKDSLEDIKYFLVHLSDSGIEDRRDYVWELKELVDNFDRLTTDIKSPSPHLTSKVISDFSNSTYYSPVLADGALVEIFGKPILRAAKNANTRLPEAFLNTVSKSSHAGLAVELGISTDNAHFMQR